MKKILLFGAGKSSTVLIDYLLEHASKDKFQLIIVDANFELAKSKIGDSPNGIAESFDIKNNESRRNSISSSDVVISLLPPDLHFIVAEDCVKYSKNLLTASYVDDQIKSLISAINDKDVLFLCEMGLDPGIDHMSAMKLINEIRNRGEKIISFKSHCGGLVAPESDDNPWHYKISWNPRNIVLAGKAGAFYREYGQEIQIQYEQLFASDRQIEIDELGSLSWYPNRDSLSYLPIYGLEDVETFIRTTLRHPDFMYGWKNLIDLKLTDETPQYRLEGKSLSDFFKEHLDKNGFSDWLQQKLMERFSQTKSLLEELVKLQKAEEESPQGFEGASDHLMRVDKKGQLENLTMDEIKEKAAGVMAHKMHEANLTLKQLYYLGMGDNDTKIKKEICSPADVLQIALEKKLSLQAGDKDMIVMMHEIEYASKNKRSVLNSTLIVKGEDHIRTAMAKTVGLPLGIATRLVLNGKINMKGLQIPIHKEIYEPVLAELELYGITFRDNIK